MFIRRRRNKSGTVSVVVVDKSSGKFRELKTIGVSSDPHEIQELERRARAWMDEHTGQLALDFDESDKVVMSAREVFSHIDRTLHNTTQVILNGMMHCETLYTTPQQEAIWPLVDILAHDARARG